MKTVKSMLFSLIALSATLMPPQAKAAYVREEVEVCEDEELNTTIGVLAGGAIGAVAGFFGSGRNPWIGAGAGVGGAALGGFLGNAASCEQRKTYYGHLQNHMRSPNYRQPYEAPGIRIAVVSEGYARWGEYCRTYHMDYVNSRNRWVEEERTTCLNRGRWQFGYDSDAVSRVVWRNPGPVYRETYYRPRWEYRVENDYYGYSYRPHHHHHRHYDYAPRGYGRVPREAYH